MNFTTLQTGGFTERRPGDGRLDRHQQAHPRQGRWRAAASSPRETFIKAYEDSDDEKMTEIRARVDALVADPETAEALKPWYRQLCKRPCFHDEYLDAYNQPGTHLIDTDGKGVERIDETGVWANGEHYELDCIIYASGFEVGTEYARRAGFETVGRDGETLSEHWADGMQSLHGIHVHGFPNLFVVGPTQGANLISNVPHNLTEAGRTIAMIIDHALEVGATQVEVTAEAEAAWVERLEGGAVASVDELARLHARLLQQRGPSRRAAAGRSTRMGYPEGPVAYFQYIDAWRSSGDFEGLEFRR